MLDERERWAAARDGDERAFRSLVAPHQRELRAYCYRMAGSLEDADDLVQESLVRAWRSLATFEGRSSFRTWLYRVAWSACVDVLQTKSPRRLTIDIGAPSSPGEPIPAPVADGWIGPCPAALYAEPSASPEARASQRESVALAFLAALQLLPPRQRAMLLARDVLGWTAEECAETLGASVASVNSALQRARETLDSRSCRWPASIPDKPTTRVLLAKYVQAWERADVPALMSLLHEEATLAMPPLPFWLLGPRDIGASIEAMVLPPEARGAFRFVATEANGAPALAAYARDGGAEYAPRALHLFEFEGPRIGSITAFLDPRVFAHFEVPPLLLD